MKNDIDQRMVLDAYETIHEYGKADDEGRRTLEGITGYTDFDGYTVYLEGHGVKMRLEFHNKYHLDYDNERQFEHFMKALENISKGHYTPERGES